MLFHPELSSSYSTSETFRDVDITITTQSSQRSQTIFEQNEPKNQDHDDNEFQCINFPKTNFLNQKIVS
jgi:hypothetical protein